MIRDLDALIRFTELEGSELPEFHDRIVITRPGASEEIVYALKSELPGIPQEYVNIITQINIDCIEIGYFNLSPGLGEDYGEKIIQRNREALPPLARRFQLDRVYQIAAWDDDPIGIVFRSGVFDVGQIIKYDFDNPEKKGVVLAESYEQFLLISGNLYSIRSNFVDDIDNDNSSNALNAFTSYLEVIFPSRAIELKAAWQEIAVVAFS